MIRNELEVDVVICTNKVDHELLGTLHDVFCQSISNINVFLILDGEDLLREWPRLGIKDKRVSLLTNEGNGLTNGLVCGVKAGSARFIARADRGDRFSPDRFELQATLLQRQPKIGVVGCESDLIYLDSSMRPIRKKRTPRVFNNRDLAVKNPLVHGSIMLRRKHYEEVGGYNVTIQNSQDLDLYLRLQLVSDISIVSPFYHRHFFYSTSSSIKRNKRQIRQGIRSRLRFLPINQKLRPAFLLYLLKSFSLLALPQFLLESIRTEGIRGIFFKKSK